MHPSHRNEKTSSRSSTTMMRCSITGRVHRICDTSGKVFLSIQDENVIMGGDYELGVIESLQPCTHEEADTRILPHCTKRGIMKVTIRTDDSDLVIISVGHFHDLHIEELSISFGVVNHFRHIPIHVIAFDVSACRLFAVCQSCSVDKPLLAARIGS